MGDAFNRNEKSMIPRLEIRFTLKQQLCFLFGKEYTPDENVFLLNHARSGILLALKSLCLLPGSKIGVMAYNCHTVFNTVKKAGYEIVFIDVTDSLTIDNDDLKRKAPHLSALIVSHLFGIENDVSSLKKEFPALPIIEDCAHAYGTKHTQGDFSVYSIGQGKLPSLGPGGILIVNNNRFVQYTRKLFNDLPSYNLGQSIALFCALLIKAFLYLPLIYTTITQHIKKNRNRPTLLEDGVMKKMSKGVSRILQDAIKRLPAMINNRINHAKGIIVELEDNTMVEKCLYGKNAFMLIIHTNSVYGLKSYFRSTGIETATHFSRCIEWAKEFGYKDNSCPNSERLINKLLMIPTY